MAKSREAFRTISEVAEWLDTPAHVLRFWESRFNQVKPVKRAGGRRYYRPNDMRLLGGIKILLHDEGITIKGVQKILREKGVKHLVELSRPLSEVPTEPTEPVKAADEAAPPPAPAPADPKPAPVAVPLRPGFGLNATPDPAPRPEKPAIGFRVNASNPPKLPPIPAPVPDQASVELKVSTAEVPKVLPGHPDRPKLDEPAAYVSDGERIKSLYFRLQALRDRMAAEMELH